MDEAGRVAARRQWENAAPGWARWEPVFAKFVEPASEAMLDMAGVAAGARVLDLACGAGSQTLRAAERAGARGRVVACDIAAAMLERVLERSRAARLRNVNAVETSAEEFAAVPGSFDAVICRLALMLFAAPRRAVEAARRALRPGGRFAAVVFTGPGANPFMARPMEILRRHAGKAAPAPGEPGIFALGAPGAIERLLADGGLVGIERRTVALSLRMPSAARTLTMMQEAFGAYRAVLADQPVHVRNAAWEEVADYLKTLETPTGLTAPAEVVVAMGANPAS